jgi:hypothetical protein
LGSVLGLISKAFHKLPMVGKLYFLLENYNLMHHAITFVKDESSNLTFMTTTLGSIVDCHLLKL